MRRFGKDARTVVRRAETEARAEGSRTVDAEHLLLALTSPEAICSARVLSEAGLGHDELRDALDGQFRDALESVGVELEGESPPARHASAAKRLQIGQSGKLALQRALLVTAKRGDRRIDACHLLIGILSAEHGTVPRALAHAQIDRRQLIVSAEEALDRV
jgi:ATP-dependent Clp protease ATP-binding subunit ClpA